jgi:hypothetical protein
MTEEQISMLSTRELRDIEMGVGRALSKKVRRWATEELARRKGAEQMSMERKL